VPNDDLELRVTSLEREVIRLREQVTLTSSDAAAARVLAAGADRDVSEVRAELRAHTQGLNALRETQLELRETQLELRKTQLAQAQEVTGLRQDVLAQGQEVTGLRQDVLAQGQEVTGLRQDVGAGFAALNTGIAEVTTLLAKITEAQHNGEPR
jgi:hypothetical protein